jgi:hypothetical protein
MAPTAPHVEPRIRSGHWTRRGRQCPQRLAAAGDAPAGRAAAARVAETRKQRALRGLYGRRQDGRGRVRVEDNFAVHNKSEKPKTGPRIMLLFSNMYKGMP